MLQSVTAKLAASSCAFAMALRLQEEGGGRGQAGAMPKRRVRWWQQALGEGQGQGGEGCMR